MQPRVVMQPREVMQPKTCRRASVVPVSG